MVRNRIAKIRLSEDEWTRLKNKAKALLGSENVSEFIRKRCLSKDLGQEEMISGLYRKLVLKNDEV